MYLNQASVCEITLSAILVGGVPRFLKTLLFLASQIYQNRQMIRVLRINLPFSKTITPRVCEVDNLGYRWNCLDRTSHHLSIQFRASFTTLHLMSKWYSISEMIYVSHNWPIKELNDPSWNDGVYKLMCHRSNLEWTKIHTFNSTMNFHPIDMIRYEKLWLHCILLFLTTI